MMLDLNEIRFYVLLLATKGNSVMSLIPLTERGSIDLDDGRLDKSVGADQFVVGSIIYNSYNTNFARDGFGTPGVGTSLKAHGAELGVTTAGTDSVNSLGSELGVGALTSEFKLSLLAVLGTLGA